MNWPGVRTSGIDWEARGSFDLGAWLLDAGVNGTYTLNYDIEALDLDGVPIQHTVQAAGRLNFGSPLVVPIPNWKTQAFLAYHRNDYSLTGTLNFVSSYHDDGAHDGYGGVPVSDFDVDRFTTLDLSLQWRAPRRGLSLTLSALNICRPRAAVRQRGTCL